MRPDCLSAQGHRRNFILSYEQYRVNELWMRIALIWGIDWRVNELMANSLSDETLIGERMGYKVNHSPMRL